MEASQLDLLMAAETLRDQFPAVVVVGVPSCSSPHFQSQFYASPRCFDSYLHQHSSKSVTVRILLHEAGLFFINIIIMQLASVHLLRLENWKQ